MNEQMKEMTTQLIASFKASRFQQELQKHSKTCGTAIEGSIPDGFLPRRRGQLAQE